MADLNTTYRPPAMATLIPSVKEFSYPDGRTFVYFEVQPPIGGPIRGCAMANSNDGAIVRATLRAAAYADLVTNCARNRVNHGGVA